MGGEEFVGHADVRSVNKGFSIRSGLAVLLRMIARRAAPGPIPNARADAEQQLRDSEAVLHRAQAVAGLAHVITAPDGSFESWSATLPPMIGVRPDAVPRNTRAWVACVHPDERESFRARAIESGRAGVRSEFEYRFRRGDGS